MTIDSTGGSVYVGGYYHGGSITASSANGGPTVNLATPPASSWEGYVVKFNQNFAIQWAVNTTDSSGLTFDDGYVQGIASSAQNTIDYVVGDRHSSTDAFVEVLDDMTGDWINTDLLTTTSSSSVQCTGVVADRSGNAYVVGTFSDQFMPTSTSAPLVSAGSTNAFLVKFDNQLDEIWGVRFGSSNRLTSITDTGDAVGIDGSSNVYVSGEDAGPASFGTSTRAVLRGNDATNNKEAYVIEVSSGGTFVAGANRVRRGPTPRAMPIRSR